MRSYPRSQDVQCVVVRLNRIIVVVACDASWTFFAKITTNCGSRSDRFSVESLCFSGPESPRPQGPDVHRVVAGKISGSEIEIGGARCTFNVLSNIP